ncbi:hypothetical protein ACLOJK_001637 [Asimina triloba]
MANLPAPLLLLLLPLVPMFVSASFGPELTLDDSYNPDPLHFTLYELYPHQLHRVADRQCNTRRKPNKETDNATMHMIGFGHQSQHQQIFPPTEILAYINLYFSEVAQLNLADRRWMELDVNGKMVAAALIIPPYASVEQEGIAKLPASSSTKITLSATSNATLPPLINAMEVLRISDTVANGTDINDVSESLASVATVGHQDVNYCLLLHFLNCKAASGDPCLPATFNWEWVDCSSDPTPRITPLYLNGFQLEGSLPDFSAMDALEIMQVEIYVSPSMTCIDMSNNSLSGVIPDFLGTLPNLKQLLSGNPNLSAPGNKFTSLNPEMSSGIGSPPSSNETPQTSPSTGSSPSIGSSPSTGSPPGFDSDPVGIPLSSGKRNKLPVLLVAGNLSFLVLCYGPPCNPSYHPAAIDDSTAQQHTFSGSISYGSSIAVYGQWW